jgi:hypothetical protein
MLTEINQSQEKISKQYAFNFINKMNCINIFCRGGKIDTSVESKTSSLQNQNGHSEPQSGTSFERKISSPQNPLSDSQPSAQRGVEETFKKEEYT